MCEKEIPKMHQQEHVQYFYIIWNWNTVKCEMCHIHWLCFKQTYLVLSVTLYFNPPPFLIIYKQYK